MRDFFFLVLTAGLGLIYSFLRSQPDMADDTTLRFVWGALLISGSVFLVRMLSYLFIEVLFPYSQDKEPSDLLRLLVSAVLYGVAAMVVLRFGFKEDLLAVVTASAIVTAVVGFALQDTLANLFAGVALQVEQPFRHGDIVRVGDVTGTVEALTWRSISLRTFDNSLLVIPNNQISNDAVEVFHAGSLIESQVTFPAPISTPPQKVIEIVNEAIRTIPNVSAEKYPYTRILAFDNASLRASVIYETTYYLEDYSEVEDTDGTVRKWIWYTLLRDGIEMIDTTLPAFRSEPPLPSLARDYDELLASNRILKALSAEERGFLAGNVTRLAFASGEPVVLKGGDSRYSMYIVSQGRLRAQLTTATEIPAELLETTGQKFDGNGSAVLSRWDPDELEDVTRELAHYIGPIARLFVKQAAGKTIDPYRLYRMLAQEIANPDHRAAFLENAPALPVAVLEPGDFFGAMSLLTGEPPVATNIEAVGQTEILEIRASTIKELLSRNSGLAPAFSQNLAEHQPHSLRSTL